ncbi:hypothetical protein HYH03_014928 [Edaphochlamys debaryana]|uniref:VTT domain-containing protein n=1 Tax=Edaphochlamys debaryana TaxID=47281 RepID=A0A835XKC5_9CHLO|nr:hypothetical protein HYH03_014928 [Edaphochlamys debaryana]|eukprot:KAG2486347.1 hypothetical protein HYH03_014928 [Edaphochlamys debaryana]
MSQGEGLAACGPQRALGTRAPQPAVEARLRDAPTPPRVESSPCSLVTVWGPSAALLLLSLAGSAEAASADADAGGLAAAALAAVSGSGWLGPAVFVALYIAATVLLFPASVMTLAAGALYGPWAGTALVSLSSTLGATAAFVASRYWVRPWVEGKVQDLPRFRAVLAAVNGTNGGYVVFLLRLSPLVPFNLLNYALGLTAVELPAYVGASWLGMLPGTFAYVALGGAGKAAVDAASGNASMSTTQLVLYGVGAVATVLATKLVSDAATRALEEQQPKGDDA